MSSSWHAIDYQVCMPMISTRAKYCESLERRILVVPSNTYHDQGDAGNRVQAKQAWIITSKLYVAVNLA
jgi:hypothetical protein